MLFIVSMWHVGTARFGAYFSLAPFFGAMLAVILDAPIVLIPMIAALITALGGLAPPHRAPRARGDRPHTASEPSREAATPSSSRRRMSASRRRDFSVLTGISRRAASSGPVSPSK